MFTGNSRKTRPPRSPASCKATEWNAISTKMGGRLVEEGRGSGNESRKVCRDPLEQRGREREDRFGGEDAKNTPVGS